MFFFKPDQQVIYNSLLMPSLTEPEFVNVLATVDSVTISRNRVIYSISVKEQKGEYLTTHIIRDVPHDALAFSGIPKEGDTVIDNFTGMHYTVSHYLHSKELYILTRIDSSEKMTAISKKHFTQYFRVLNTAF